MCIDTLLLILSNNQYEAVKKSKSKIMILTNENRIKVLDEISLLFPIGIFTKCSDSSLGCWLTSGVKIFVKSVGKSNGLDYENFVISSIQQKINYLGMIDLRIGEKIYEEIVGVKKTEGTPKSDFEFINSYGDSVLYVSHKKGDKPNHFQQWSGLTDAIFFNHREVQSFIEYVYERKKTLHPRDSFCHPIESEELKHLACFGKDSLSGISGKNSVDLIIQGDVNFYANGNHYELIASNIWQKGQIPKEGFTPVFAINYRSDRDQFGIENARFSVYPKEGRKFDELS